MKDFALTLNATGQKKVNVRGTGWFVKTAPHAVNLTFYRDGAGQTINRVQGQSGVEEEYEYVEISNDFADDVVISLGFGTTEKAA